MSKTSKELLDLLRAGRNLERGWYPTFCFTLKEKEALTLIEDFRRESSERPTRPSGISHE